MIFLSIGLPSRFAETCGAIAAQLVGDALGPTELVYADTPEEVAVAAVRSKRRHLVIAARQPTEKFCSALASSEVPFLVLLDDPRLALEHLVVRGGVEWNEATRATANACAAILHCAEMPRGCVLRADPKAPTTWEIAVALADALGLPIDPARFAQFIEAGGGSGLATAAPEFDAWWDTVGQEQRDLADGALTGYVDCFAGGQLGELSWGRELFFLGDDPQQSAGRPVELGGAVRNLVFGPYIALPPGRWSATVSLAVSREAVDMDFRIEVLAGPRCTYLAVLNTVPDGRGRSFATLVFDVDRATEQPLVVRVANLRPATGGRFAFGRVGLRLLVDAPIEVLAEFAVADS